ncbi:PDZ and LIM domain protein 7 [Pleurodeles waltl]|uniref:PDZ and LIM domain protein 7 n=1 Tax=Pleurodeles waltl TaxID=8319 RepID=UPI00370983D6
MSRVPQSSPLARLDMESYKVTLDGPAPWGFRLQGGKDFSMPLSISRLSPGGKSELAGVSVGDWVLSIDGESTSSMTHIEAQNKIRSCTDRLSLSLSRVAPPKAQKDQLSFDSEAPKYNFAPSTALNKTAQPFGARTDQENSSPGLVTKPVMYTPPAPTYGVNPTSRVHHNGCFPYPLSTLCCLPLPSVHPLSLLFIHSPSLSCSLTYIFPVTSHLDPSAVANPPALKAQPSSNEAFPALTPAALASFYLDDKHSLRMESHPAYLANDSSKKRLVEDTEDWQPRTGTAQSRSFRILAQLTDTDFMQDPDDEHVKRASAIPVPAAPAPAAVTPPAQRPPPTGPAVRPPWAIDPTFAERYAPDKTTTVLTKHSQPATPTPMQNRNSIVQAAQQPPESGARTPICYQCNKIIRGRYLVALGQYYHPEEFTCSQCRKVLEEGGFFEENGSIFCPKCYDMRFAPNCAKCKKKITGEIMHALKMAWHVQCFTCAACKIPIRNRAFYMEEGRPYCEKDFEMMFGTKCRGCDFKIDAGDRFLEALGYSWHDTCFVCAICQINLEGKTFYSKKDKPLCKTHAFSPV